MWAGFIVREFASSPWFVKICAVTSTSDADIVVDAGASALGVILTTSLRRVDARSARAITQRVGGRLVTIAVVDSRVGDSIEAVLGGVGVDAVQVHGDLSETLLDEFRSLDLGVIKALSVGSEEFASFDEERVDAILVDGPVPGSGTAHSFNGVRDRGFRRPVIAAGGLTALSVTAVIGAHDVWGVDVASGVESSPGVKDPLRVTEFVEAARRSFVARAAT
jgi:phosphoribosylanthranilate isomerase